MKINVLVSFMKNKTSVTKQLRQALVIVAKKCQRYYSNDGVLCNVNFKDPLRTTEENLIPRPAEGC